MRNIPLHFHSHFHSTGVFDIFIMRFELVTAYVHQARKNGDAECVCVNGVRILYIVHAKSWTNLYIFIWNDKRIKVCV